MDRKLCSSQKGTGTVLVEKQKGIGIVFVEKQKGISSAENQKRVIAVQGCSVDNQKGATVQVISNASGYLVRI